jgi:dipeptidyl-peptidase-3
MHEVIGHGSGRMAPDVTAPPHKLLGEQDSSIEEARADLVALYFLPDAKLAELGIVPVDHHDEIVATEYEYYVRNALLQLRRVREGDQLEEDHMRNRQMIVNWLRAHTDAVDVRTRDGKTYYVMVDASAFREGVGRLLAEVQRIKGEGDGRAARELFETYGVRFDPALRDEIVARVDQLRLPSYTGFVMPRLAARTDETGAIVDVEISYPCDLETQMLEYSAFARQNDVVARSATP